MNDVGFEHRRGSTQVSVPGGEELMLVALRRPVRGEFVTVLHGKSAFGSLTVESCRPVPEELLTTVYT